MLDLRYGLDCRDAMQELPRESVQCVVTSPPYYALRDYGVDGQIGLESSLAAFVAELVDVFRSVRRVMHPSGTLWVNLGDSYSGNGSPGGESSRTCQGAPNARDKVPTKPGVAKSLLMAPFHFALAMQGDGWILRDVIVWHKPCPMPESVRDRCTKAWEPIFMFARSPRYFADMEAVKVAASEATHGRTVGQKQLAADSGTNAANADYASRITERVPFANLRNVWKIGPEGFKGKHFATFPSELPRRCVMIGTSAKGCCPACFSPWVRVVARKRSATRTAANGGKDKGVDDVLMRSYDPHRHVTATETTGWVAGCKCGAGDPVPCTVLDPFSGTATTGAVAVHLGRRYIGLDLNAAYEPMARERVAGLLAKWAAKRPKTTQAKRRKRNDSHNDLWGNDNA